MGMPATLMTLEGTISARGKKSDEDISSHRQQGLLGNGLDQCWLEAGPKVRR